MVSILVLACLFSIFNHNLDDDAFQRFVHSLSLLEHAPLTVNVDIPQDTINTFSSNGESSPNPLLTSSVHLHLPSPVTRPTILRHPIPPHSSPNSPLAFLFLLSLLLPHLAPNIPINPPHPHHTLHPLHPVHPHHLRRQNPTNCRTSRRRGRGYRGTCSGS